LLPESSRVGDIEEELLPVVNGDRPGGDSWGGK